MRLGWMTQRPLAVGENKRLSVREANLLAFSDWDQGGGAVQTADVSSGQFHVEGTCIARAVGLLDGR